MLVVHYKQRLHFFRPTLKHQRPQEEKQQQFSSLNEWYKKGTKEVSEELSKIIILPLHKSVMAMGTLKITFATFNHWELKICTVEWCFTDICLIRPFFNRKNYPA